MSGHTSVSDVVEFRLADNEFHDAAATVSALVAEFGTATNPEFVRQAPGLGHLLPPGLSDALLAMRYDEVCAALVVRSGPVPDPGSTPPSWQARHPEATTPHDVWLMLVLAQLGDPMAWANLQDGRLFNDILPTRGAEHDQTAFGSEAELVFHVEEADHDNRSDAFGLLCLRNAAAVPTTVASVDAIQLSEKDRRVLGAARFHIGEPHTPVPVLFGATDRPYLRIDPPYTAAVPGDTEARRALAALVDGLAAALVDVVLAPGDLLVVDYYRAVHGRRSFQPGYDGGDRWLRRLSVTRDLRRFRAQRSAVDDRVVVPVVREAGRP